MAVRGVMDAFQRSSSFGGEGESLLRQPSAEDLDAAHQLVSSARGERHGSNIPLENHATDSTTDQNPLPVSPRPTDAAQSPRPASEQFDQTEDSSGLGQICRYVLRITALC